MEARRYPKNSTNAFEIFGACGKNEQRQVSPYGYEWICSWNEKPRETEETMESIREDCDEMKVDLHTATHMAHDQRQWRETWRHRHGNK